MGNFNNEKMKIDIIKELFSQEMSDYLCENINYLSEHDFSKIIGLSLLDINKKHEYSIELGLKDLEVELKNAIDNLERNDDEIFYLSELSRNTSLEYLLDESEKHKYYHSDIIRAIDTINHEICFGDRDEEHGLMPFLDYKNVFKYISDDKIFENDGQDFIYDDLYYFKLEKYKKRDKNDILRDCNSYSCKFIGDMYLVCEYYIVNSKIVFYKEYDYSRINKMRYPHPRFVYTRYIYDSVDLNLSIPFKAGDIVSCNLKPFSNNKNMLIISVGDNKDCCAVQVAFIDQYGKLSVGALKHSDIRQNQVFPCISPLYTLRSISEDELTLHEKLVFIDIQKKIDGDEKRGKEINRYWTKHEWGYYK